MSKIFMVSDTHFGHKGVCEFKRDDGVTDLRPYDTADEMDADMIEKWNAKVGPNDKVYHLGDVVINRKALPILSRLNGEKVLIKGNHDIFRLEEYTPYFKDVRSYHILNGLILSHIPVHAASLGRFGTNIHGHLHATRVKLPRGVDARTGEILYSDSIDPRYFNMCVENHNYAPVEFEEVMEMIRAQGGTVGFREHKWPNEKVAD